MNQVLSTTQITPSVQQEVTTTINSSSYFATYIYQVKFPDAKSINAYLLPIIRHIRANDTQKIERSNVLRLGGWHSHDNLHNMREFANLKERIHMTAKVISQELSYDPNYELKIKGMWSIINPPGGFNLHHIHPNSLWSGVYYIQTPKNSGAIKFVDPRVPHLMCPPKYDKKNRTKKNKHTKKIKPEAGLMILFPSWLYHSVNPNFTNASGDNAERVCISFNLKQSLIKYKDLKTKIKNQ